MKNKYKAFFEIMLIAAAFAAIWISGILIYGELVCADTMYIGSLFGEKREKLFVFTPALLLMLSAVLTNVSVKKKAKHIFITTEIMLLLPVISWALGNLLLVISNGLLGGTALLGIPGFFMVATASPFITWLGLLGEFDGYIYVFGALAYVILSLLNIVLYRRIKRVS